MSSSVNLFLRTGLPSAEVSQHLAAAIEGKVTSDGDLIRVTRRGIEAKPSKNRLHASRFQIDV